SRAPERPGRGCGSRESRKAATCRSSSPCSVRPAPAATRGRCPIRWLLRRVRCVELAHTIGGHAPPFSQSDRLTRVCRAHVLAALTKPPAHRLRRLRPPPPSPAPCQARDVRARRSHKPAWALFRYW